MVSPKPRSQNWRQHEAANFVRQLGDVSNKRFPHL